MATNNKLNFTKKDLSDIPFSEDSFYWDTRTRGLYLRVSNGAKGFYVRRKLKGKSERFFLGRFPELSVEQARAKAADFHASLAKGSNLADARRAEFSEPTLGDLFGEYMERHAKKSKKTWEDIEKQFARNFFDWRGRKVSSITRDEVEKLHRTVGEVRGPYAANRAIQLLRAMYNKANRWGLYEGKNPAANITPFPEHSRVRILQLHEFARFFRALDEEQEKDIKDFVMLSLLTGARKSNVLAMRWSDIDRKAALWTIPSTDTKNSRAHAIPLTDSELEILERRWNHQQREAQSSIFVFPGDGRTGHLVEPKRAWRTLLKRAQIEDLHLHDLRRSMASWMANAGANVALIQSALNHKDIKTTLSVYTHTVKDAERTARQKAHELMLGQKKDTGCNSDIRNGAIS
jgi:integrase